MTRNIFSNPLTPFIGIISTNIITLAFTKPTSGFRYVGLIVILLLSWMMLENLFLNKLENEFLNSVLGGICICYPIFYIDVALLSKWAFEVRGPTSSLGGLHSKRRSSPRKDKSKSEIKSEKYKRLCFGLWMSTQCRYVGTPWQVKNVPPFKRSNPKMVPTKQDFITTTTVSLVLHVLLLDFVGVMGGDTSKNPVNFATGRIPLLRRLSDVSIEEIIIRVVSILIYWTMSYAYIQAVKDFLALTSVLLGLCSHREWPPLFGSFTDCWSVRQFWGVSWHQTLRQHHGSHSHFIVYKICGMRKGTFIARYTHIFFVFFLSGVLHVGSELGNGLPYSESGSMRFFTMQTAAIMFEDSVQAIYRHFMGLERGQSELSVLSRVIGYLWTFIWLVWSTPSWAYPTMARGSGGHTLPFSALRAIRK